MKNFEESFFEESFKDIKDNTNYKLKMEKNEELQNEFHFAISREPLLNSPATGLYARVDKYLRIFSYLFLFTGIGILLNSCVGGYIASEPAYVEYARPQRPSETSIWIDGDWGWNYQTHVYVQRAGSWERPRQGQTFVSGHWQSTQRGKSWSKGYWQKQSRQQNNQESRKNNNRNR